MTVRADETGDIILPAIEPGTEITVCIFGSDRNGNDADGAVSNEASIFNYQVDSNVTNDTSAASETPSSCLLYTSDAADE